MVTIYGDECEVAGKDRKAINALARKLAKISDELDALGVYVFGGSGSGSIRCRDGFNGPLVLATFGQGFDGGDGACNDYGPDGLMRGE